MQCVKQRKATVLANTSSLRHVVSNKFQASWLQENDRHLWLEDYGMDADGPRAGCQAPKEQQPPASKTPAQSTAESLAWNGGTLVMQAGCVDIELQAVPPPTAN
eukprot:927563-Pelagomonas_calceolata.AAC.7